MSKIKEYFQSLVKTGTIPQEPSNYDAETLKIYIDHLESENAALRERLDKAVELPRIIHPNEYEWFVQYQNKYGLIFDKIFYSERAAEACLKELKEKNDD